jgi:hypothetical protein
MKAYILTSEWNMYDQMGEYFIAWFDRKPTFEELKKVILEDEEDVGGGDDAIIIHILENGGGRLKPYKATNEHWYNLREIKSSCVAN